MESLDAWTLGHANWLFCEACCHVEMFKRNRDTLAKMSYRLNFVNERHVLERALANK